jgi:hypothetical protein
VRSTPPLADDAQSVRSQAYPSRLRPRPLPEPGLKDEIRRKTFAQQAILLRKTLFTTFSPRLLLPRLSCPVQSPIRSAGRSEQLSTG